MVAGLYFSYIYYQGGDNISNMYEPKEIRWAWREFKNWANKKMNDIDTYIDEVEDDESVEIAIEAILNWPDCEELASQLKEDKYFYEAESFEELRKNMRENKDYSEWDNAIETYWEEIRYQIIERLM